MVGQTVSHYRILSKLGSGGMGVVFLAEDLRLKRQVALKFMPEELAGNRGALDRFRREAEAASALNHANICVVHDIDEAAGRPFIAMEYLAGRTLDHLIGDRGIRLPDAFRYAIQITDALAKAHTAGIIHRDIKPSNILVTDDGLVKVLDFGLAKLVEKPAPGDEADTCAPAGGAQTEEGTIVGTVAYMSPEQAQGRPVDARSDIFSFGSVLYEMVTGRRAFSGESRISILGAILHADPAPTSGTGAAVPPEVERIIARCLRKDPQRRWQTMSDLKVALQDAREEVESGTQAGIAPARAHRWRWVWVAVPVMAVAAAAVAIAVWATRPPPVIELRPERFTADPGITTSPAISLDGKLVAYASDRSGEGSFDIYVQHINVGEPRRLTQDAADEYDPSLSPDGSQVVFRSERDGGGLYIAETLGGVERKLATGGRSPRFSPDGSTIAYLEDRATGFPPVQKIFLVPARGGSPKAFLPAFGVAARVLRPTLSFSADGKYLAFSGWRSGSAPALDWWVAPIDGGQPVGTNALARYQVPRIPLLEPAAWHGPNLYFLRGSLVEGIHIFCAPLDPVTWSASSPARQLTSGGGLHFALGIAENGTAVVSVLNVAQDFASLPLPPQARDGAAAPLTTVTSDATIKGGVSVSRDGTVAAYAAYVSWETGRIEIRVRALATGRETVYRSDNLSPAANPQISPDGSLLAYSERIDGKQMSFIGQPESLPGRFLCENCQVLGISSDSRWALVRYGTGRIERRDLSTGAERRLLTVAAGEAVLDARLSPDDRWVAFIFAEPGRQPQVYVAPISGDEIQQEKWKPIPGNRLYEESSLMQSVGFVATSRPPSPVWSADGNEIYYFSDRDGHACIWAQRLDQGTKEPQGPAYPLYHLHRPETSPAVFGTFMFLAASRDKLILPKWTVTGNIWTAQLKEQ